MRFRPLLQHLSRHTALRQIGLYAGSQGASLALAFFSGMLIVRLLPPSEYALYTIANSVLGMITILADGGIGAGITALGGRVWQNPRQLGTVVATGMALRKKFTVGGLLLGIPYLTYVLHIHGASWTATITIAAMTCVLLAVSVTSLPFENVLSLHQDLPILSSIGISSAVGRLACLMALLFAAPFAAAALLAFLLPQIVANLRLRRRAAKFAILTAQESQSVRTELLKLVARTLPGSAYFAISGQVTTWLVSIFGSTAAVAQVGALGRLSQILGILSLVIGGTIVPRFARLPEQSNKLFLYPVLLICSIAVLLATIIAILLIWPAVIPFILGRQYANLSIEATLAVTGSGLGIIGGIVFKLGNSRGWIIPPWFSIPLALACDVAAIMISDLGSTKGVLLFSIYSGALPFVVSILFLFWKVRPRVVTHAN